MRGRDTSVTPIKDYGWEAQLAAERHLEAVVAAQDAYDDGDMTAFDDLDMAAPFCGCTTCWVRETLYVAWPILRQAALAGAE